MKSEHRHELKRNELVEFLHNTADWAKANYKTIIYVSVVVILATGAGLWKNYENRIVRQRLHDNFNSLVAQIPAAKMQVLQSQVQGQQASALLMDMASEFQNIADTAKNNELATTALIERAQLLRADLHYRVNTTEQEIAAQIEQARQAYESALNKARNNSALAAAAQFGLALCQEELGDYDAARGIYTEIVENDRYKGTTFAAEAKLRLETMGDYSRKVVFAEPQPQQPVSQEIPEIFESPVGLETEVPAIQPQTDQPEIAPEATVDIELPESLQE